MICQERISCHVQGYPATIDPASARAFASITDDYASEQQRVNVEKCENYLLPIVRRLGAHRMLDAGCGVGTMVTHLNSLGFDCHGFDLLENASRWAAFDLPRNRFVITDPYRLQLPYDDATFDLIFSFGAIEHIGTTNGHSDRRPDYAEIRTAWVRELFRTIRVGGSLFLAGPNRNFPVDTAHGLDTRASTLEFWLTQKLGVTLHKPWGPNFLWGYSDVRSYCHDLPCRIEGLSVDGLVNFSRVAGPLKWLAEAYVRHLPKPLTGTGFNPWTCALITRTD